MLTMEEFREKILSLPQKKYEELGFFDNEGKPRKTRNYECVFYPESSYDDFLTNIEDCKIKCCLSPLHDKDKDRKGKTKKAHFHFMICYDNTKSPYQAYCDFCYLFGEKGFSTFEKVKSVSASTRYMAHLGFDDKYQYNVSEIKGFNGFNVEKYLVEDLDVLDSMKEFREIIKANNIVIYDDLLEYLEKNGRDDLLLLLYQKSRLSKNVMEILRSRGYKYKKIYSMYK